MSNHYSEIYIRVCPDCKSLNHSSWLKCHICDFTFESVESIKIKELEKRIEKLEEKQPKKDNSFAALVQSAYVFNLRHRAKLTSDIRESMNPIHYLAEFCTVHINVGRQTGKTQYIIDNCYEDDMVITLNREMADTYKVHGVQHVYTIQQLVDLSLRMRFNTLRSNTFKNVYFDESYKSVRDYRSNLQLILPYLKMVSNPTIFVFGD